MVSIFYQSGARIYNAVGDLLSRDLFGRMYFQRRFVAAYRYVTETVSILQNKDIVKRVRENFNTI